MALHAPPQLSAPQLLPPAACIHNELASRARSGAQGVGRGECRTRERLPAMLHLLSGWDAIVLLLDGAADTVLDAVLTSALAPRGLAQVALSEAGLTPTVVRVLAAARDLPPARVPLVPEMVSRVQTLPDEVSQRVFDAVRAPSQWNVKRLCAACGMTRRSLERMFARVGLPTPAALLAQDD